MRYLVISDIHANLEALDACLADAAARGYDRTLVLGDVVGYGPDPNAVVDRVMALQPTAIVRGNHDKIAFGMHQAEGFNHAAKTAAQWTFDSLTPAHRAWLTELPQGPLVVDDCVEICHGSPIDEDEYIFDELDARRALDASRQRVCLFGHTHVPMVFRLSGRVLGLAQADGNGVAIEVDSTYLANPGSVGQPRDGDSRAAYAIFDVESQRLHLLRVEYSVHTTQSKMAEVGLPEPLIRRLGVGR